MTRKLGKETGRARQAGLAAFLLTHSQASLQMGYQKLRSIRFANDPVSRWFFYFSRKALPDQLGRSRSE
jgi:hypothetical protein